MAILPDGYRPSTPEELAEDSRSIRAAFEPKPLLVRYEAWSVELDALCRERKISLAYPSNLDTNSSLASRGGARGGAQGAVEPIPVTITDLLRYQEAFYSTTYGYSNFTIDRSKLALPRDRLDDIKAALLRGEVDYPLVVATSAFVPIGVWSSGVQTEGRPTLHRVLFDRLIRQRNIAVWSRTDPTVDDFLEQLRDLTLQDLTRTDLLGPDGNPLAFDKYMWLPYLQALYPTLPRPTATPGYADLSFVKWEQDPFASRVIPDAQGPRGDPVTIQDRSQLDAVSFRYPLITPSRHLALFSQYHAATGQHLDTIAWSWTFGIVDPQQFPDHPVVIAHWDADELNLNRYAPWLANSNSRLRSSR